MMFAKERKLYEMHGDMVEHGQPVMSIFHRPRAEATLLEEQGLDPRLASFLFVDLASLTLALGCNIWSREGWLRGTVEVHPVPFSMPAQPTTLRDRAFALVPSGCPAIVTICRFLLPRGQVLRKFACLEPPNTHVNKRKCQVGA